VNAKFHQRGVKTEPQRAQRKRERIPFFAETKKEYPHSLRSGSRLQLHFPSEASGCAFFFASAKKKLFPSSSAPSAAQSSLCADGIQRLVNKPVSLTRMVAGAFKRVRMGAYKRA